MASIHYPIINHRVSGGAASRNTSIAPNTVANSPFGTSRGRTQSPSKNKYTPTLLVSSTTGQSTSSNQASRRNPSISRLSSLEPSRNSQISQQSNFYNSYATPTPHELYAGRIGATLNTASNRIQPVIIQNNNLNNNGRKSSYKTQNSNDLNDNIEQIIFSPSLSNKINEKKSSRLNEPQQDSHSTTNSSPTSSSSSSNIINNNLNNTKLKTYRSTFINNNNINTDLNNLNLNDNHHHHHPNINNDHQTNEINSNNNLLVSNERRNSLINTNNISYMGINTSTNAPKITKYTKSNESENSFNYNIDTNTVVNNNSNVTSSNHPVTSNGYGQGLGSYNKTNDHQSINKRSSSPLDNKKGTSYSNGYTTEQLLSYELNDLDNKGIVGLKNLGNTVNLNKILTKRFQNISRV